MLENSVLVLRFLMFLVPASEFLISASVLCAEAMSRHLCCPFVYST